jgi:hypothetical protein
MHGGDLVRSTTLPAATELSARRVLPGRPLRPLLRHEHHHHKGRPAAASLPTTLFDRHGDRHYTYMPAPLPARQRHEQHGDDRLPATLHNGRHQHAHQHHRGLLSASLPAALHGRPSLPDDRLPNRPAVTASSMPHLQR